ncbi:MAG: DUF885 domain-containing protein [Xanthomonadales bacterium]|jgi:uncharacterized protein (DUF885 family)|nr:DUF885 domain-containing protein [Xanthomonadales bacterium]
MIAIRLIAVLAPLVLLGCEPTGQGETPPAAATPPASAQSNARASQELNQLFEEYFEGKLVLNPTFATYIGDNRYNDRYVNNISPAWREAARALEQDALARINAIDPTSLEGQELLSYEIFKSDRKIALEYYDFPSHLMPINQFYSAPNSFVQLGSGTGVQPFDTVEDYENFLSRIDGFVTWTEQAQANMREGISQGLTQPRVLMERVVPQLESQLVSTVEQSAFYEPISNMPESFSAEDRARLTAAYVAAIETKLIPAYRKLRDFVRDEYIPAARETHGINALPGGPARYAYLVRETTTTNLTPEQIHAIGLAEVSRIHEEIQGVMNQVEFEGDLHDFFEFLNTDPQFYFTERQDLLDGYNALRDVIEPNAPRLFKTIPKAGYEIRLVEPFREKSASGGQYRGASPDGSRPGVFFANAYDLSARPKWAMDSLFLHEAVPGHHFQGALTLELDELPRFRQFGGYTAYGEGWGLYAESLGRELGAYTDPYQYFGKLNAELWRAIRLVVDTGIHYYGWTREQVLEYMYANSAVGEARAVSETERFMAIPSQALAYKIGELKIQELRHRAEAALGEKFDIREFHAQVLEAGELPLGVLEARIDRWIEAEAGGM